MISHYVGKTELVLFISIKKQRSTDLEIKLPGKRLYEADSVSYVGIQMDKKPHIETTDQSCGS